ncbi:hypothetical protein DAPPUDRAFT_235651 [Daphnia pulex]|uniref:Uncharacterized protein n=1 Tax=Daphnia pulex TaxID=6669 RepID=E9G0F7_DAPPU|nr:hypothetical protein DAPPUDRAFT_235651 [Daphnia pulex]|eukprot:EFX87413.1 hypothetical protein DAPPUDRAFT_235651 [Daphnia pulex]
MLSPSQRIDFVQRVLCLDESVESLSTFVILKYKMKSPDFILRALMELIAAIRVPHKEIAGS